MGCVSGAGFVPQRFCALERLDQVLGELLGACLGIGLVGLVAGDPAVTVFQQNASDGGAEGFHRAVAQGGGEPEQPGHQP